MKGFFDVWLLSRQFDFVGKELAVAIANAFENRETELESDPIALTAAFTTAENASTQWAAFIRRSNLPSAPATLEEIRLPLRQFLVPTAAAIVEGREFSKLWTGGGPWRCT